MKKLIVLLVLLVSLTFVNAQSFNFEGNTYSSSGKVKLQLVETPYQYKSPKTGEVYTIFINKENGHCYTKRVNKEGKPYNSEIHNVAIAKDVATKMGIVYIETEKNPQKL